MHARRLIVNAVVTALAGLTSAGGRVYAGRAAPKTSEAAPYLLVYARREQSDSLTMGGANRKIQRELILAVEGITASATDSDAEADQLALEVEARLHADPKLGGACKDLWLTSTDLIAAAEGETRTGRIRLEFTVQYQTVASAPDTSV